MALPAVRLSRVSGGSIFISYRREDSAGESGRLAEHLARRFGSHHVFIDIDAIAPGSDFVSTLDRAVTASTVVLVVIGRQWLTVSTPAGSRRLDDPDDFVRREVSTALEQGARVIPVLVQNAAMPAADGLPPALTRLATLQAVTIQHEEFGADAERLANAIAPFVASSSVQRAWYRRPAAIAVMALLVLLLGVSAVALQRAGARRAEAERAAAERTRRQQAFDAQVTVAEGQFSRGQFGDALDTLERAGTAPDDATRAAALREDIAMQWIRELRVAEGQSWRCSTSVPRRPPARGEPTCSPTWDGPASFASAKAPRRSARSRSTARRSRSIPATRSRT